MSGTLRELTDDIRGHTNIEQLHRQEWVSYLTINVIIKIENGLGAFICYNAKERDYETIYLIFVTL